MISLEHRTTQRDHKKTRQRLLEKKSSHIVAHLRICGLFVSCCSCCSWPHESASTWAAAVDCDVHRRMPAIYRTERVIKMSMQTIATISFDALDSDKTARRLLRRRPLECHV